MPTAAPPPGDQVTDTPPEAVSRNGCPTTALTSCTAANDPIENFMDYTNDPCRFAFTAGQTTRMQTAIGAFRSNLVSAQNLIDVGCPSGLNALISVSRGQICAPDTVTFTTPAVGAGYTYAWTFPGGTPSSATTQSAVVSYPTPGVYPATLTVTDGGPNSSTNSLQIYVRSCTPISGTLCELGVAGQRWVQLRHRRAGAGGRTHRPAARDRFRRLGRRRADALLHRRAAGRRAGTTS